MSFHLISSLLILVFLASLTYFSSSPLVLPGIVSSSLHFSHLVSFHGLIITYLILTVHFFSHFFPIFSFCLVMSHLISSLILHSFIFCILFTTKLPYLPLCPSCVLFSQSCETCFYGVPFSSDHLCQTIHACHTMAVFTENHSECTCLSSAGSKG